MMKTSTTSTHPMLISFKCISIYIPTILLLLLVVSVCEVNAQQQQQQGEQLRKLYNATGGEGWRNSSGWMNGEPCIDDDGNDKDDDKDDEDDEGEDAWYGVHCLNGSVVSIDLTENNLVGTLPPLALPSLSSLLLGKNINLYGPLPDYSNTNLTEIYVNDTQINGTFPNWFSQCPNLHTIYLSNTSIGGEFPVSWCSMPNLQRLSLGNQPLTGTLPDCIGNIRTLQWLEIYSTPMYGSIPDSITNLDQLTYLELNYNNFSGTIPQNIGAMTSLERLTLYNNQLEGTLPPSIGDLPNILEIHLRDNAFSGTVPANLANALSLISLGLESNYFTGPIPAWLSPETMTNLLSIDLRCNNFEDPLPEWLKSDPAKDADFAVWFGCNNITEDSLPKWCLDQTRCGANACDGSRCAQQIIPSEPPNKAVIISLACFLGFLLLGNIALLVYLIKRKCMRNEHNSEMQPILGISKKKGLVNLADEEDDD